MQRMAQPAGATIICCMMNLSSFYYSDVFQVAVTLILVLVAVLVALKQQTTISNIPVEVWVCLLLQDGDLAPSRSGILGSES